MYFGLSMKMELYNLAEMSSYIKPKIKAKLFKSPLMRLSNFAMVVFMGYHLKPKLALEGSWNSSKICTCTGHTKINISTMFTADW